MSQESKYRTVKNLSEGLYKEKGSKFIGYIQACYNEEQAKELLDNWRKSNRQAGHLCYAYRFGVDKTIYRSNDDGEPSNSAGAPILGQINSYDLSNVLIGVVRYYGGTKLGVGGLINAYRTAAKEAIENALIIEKEIYKWVVIRFEYIDMPNVMNLLKKRNLEMSNSTFELKCELTTYFKLDLVEVIEDELKGLSTVNIDVKGIY